MINGERNRFMGKTAILPLSSLSRFDELFRPSNSAEGSIGWFQSLADTTLENGEEAVVVVALDDGAARAALPFARRGERALRALTAPYTTLYAPALHEPRWARATTGVRVVSEPSGRAGSWWPTR